MLKKLYYLFLTIIILGVSSIFTFYLDVKGLGKTRIISHGYFTVAKGDSFATVVEGLIGKQSALKVKAYGFFNKELTNVKFATYDMAQVHDLKEALELINKGNGAVVKVPLIPGKAWKQWKESIFEIKNVNSSLLHDKDSKIIKELGIEAIPGDENFNNLEGYFLPDTYNIYINAPISQALNFAYDALKEVLLTEWKERSSAVPLKSPYELLIMASIIEKEKGNDEEAPTIASVFYNRININMPLQTDPTVIYGMGDSYKGNITRKDLQTPTAYNTYTMKGLPPTPIAMVSEASIKAAAHPATSKYLYFVANYKQKSHNFSETYKEHAQKVKDYVKAYKADSK